MLNFRNTNIVFVLLMTGLIALCFYIRVPVMLFVAVMLFTLIAGASFGWAAIEGQGGKRSMTEARVVSLPN